MATTRWIAGSGDWNTASSWTDGVPGAADTALFDQTLDTSAPYTVSGGGAAAALTIIDDATQSGTLALAGTITVGTFTTGYAELHLTGTAALSFRSGQVYAAGVQLDAGATLGGGPLALTNARLDGTLGVLANPLDLAGTSSLLQTSGTLAGAITGSGRLELGSEGFFLNGGDLVLSHAGNTYAGGTDLVGGRLEIAAPGAAGTGPVSVQSGTLVLDAGVSLGAFDAAIQQGAAVSTVDGDDTVFSGIGGLSVANGSGHVEVIGRFGLGNPFAALGTIPTFEGLSVTGGTGSVTVFAADAVASLFGGTGGGNVLVAGSTITDPVHDAEFAPPGVSAAAYDGSLIGGGGNGDLLVAAGNTNNVVAAGGGNETLTGSGALGDNSFFGGTGSDLIVAGGGHDVLVAASGAATLVGGSGTTAIFAGSGVNLVLGGSAADYVQIGSGMATLFTGAGADLIGVAAGKGGGSLVVSGFRPATDRIAAQGYAGAPTITAAGGNTVLGFSDRTQVTLLGVVSVPGSVFV